MAFHRHLRKIVRQKVNGCLMNYKMAQVHVGTALLHRQLFFFHSIKSSFLNKPFIIAYNKIDLQPLEGISEEDMKLVMESKTGAISHEAQSQDEDAFVQASAAVATGEGIPTCESFVANFCSTTGQESVTDILLPHLISDWVPFSVNDQKKEEYNNCSI